MAREKLTLEQLVYQRLKAWDKASERIVRFPVFFSRVCPIYCLTKKQAWQVMRSMQELGMVDIVPYHGIRVKSE